MQSTLFSTVLRHLIACIVCFCAFAGLSAQDAPEKTPEVMPVLNSCAMIEDRSERETCSNQGIMEHIINKLNYPKEAQEAGIEGTVIVKFVIDKTGMITKSVVVRGQDKHLRKEALRLVNSIPKLIAAKQRGKSVPCSFTVPINFRLQ